VNHRSNPRRDFLRTVSIGSTVAAAAGLEACASSVSALATSSPPQPAGQWDLSWVDRLKAPYRVVFNITQKNDLGLMQTWMWMDGFRQAHGTEDDNLNAVLVFRHEAVAMMLDDAMWARMAIMESSSGTGSGNTAATPPGRNPWLSKPASRAPSGSQDTDYTISALRARGVIMLACNMALRGQVSRLRQKETLAADEADRAIRNAIVPGCTIVPNGIFGVSRAQMAGCAYFAPG
jgi:intracellular sulfur oxidation DsrE/DsrF family protein